MTGHPSDAATLERAVRLTDEAMHVVALQRRRLRTTEPEDDSFLFRRWTDWQFFIVSLCRLRRAAGIALAVEVVRDQVQQAINEFDGALPVRLMRNVAEHIDEYAIGRGRHAVDRRALEVGAFDETELHWRVSTTPLNADDALARAECLHATLLRASRS